MSKGKSAIYLAKERGLGSHENDFYNYIILSGSTGQWRQVRSLFMEMDNYYKKEFLVDYLQPAIGIHKSVMNYCIDELLG